MALGLGAAAPARADMCAGALGVAPGATDVYCMTCPIGTASARADIDDAGGADAIQVSVLVINPHGPTATQSAVDGGGFSAVAGLANGPGNYLVSVHKDVMGFQNYTVRLDCYNAGGMPLAGLQSALVQDQ